MDASIVIAVKLTKQPLWTFKRRYAVEYANVEAVCGGGPEFLSNCELDSARMFVQYLESRRWNSKGVEEAVGKLARKLCKLLDQENTDRKLVVFGFLSAAVEVANLVFESAVVTVPVADQDCRGSCAYGKLSFLFTVHK
jgi:hypothetical protein